MVSALAAPRWPGWVVMLGTMAVAAQAGLTLWRYPAIVHDPAAPAYLIILGIALVGYLVCAGWGIYHRRPGQVGGLLIGSIAGVMWSVEIWAGGPALLDRPTERAVGGTFALLAVGITVAAGVSVGAWFRDRGAAVRAGLFAGLTSGLVVFLAGTGMTLATLRALGTRTDYRAQFAHSRTTDIATFLIGDILAAVTAHLVINVLLGLTGGILGAFVAIRTGRRGAGPMAVQPQE